ncbi:aminomethyl transferase family protein [Halostagnicola bangensis]
MSERAWSFSDSMEEAVEAAGNPVELMQDLGVGQFTKVPDEYTHWIEEQRSWRETVALADQSYHMTDHHVKGPDAVEFYSNFGINNFENTEPGKAKQLVVSNPNGYFIGDAILFHLDDDEFLSVGGAAAHNWLQYQIETGEYDVTGELQGRPVQTGDDPNNFRFQVQGPEAIKVMEEAADEPLPDLGFFNFESISIDGKSVNLLRHGMAGEPGFEFWGPYEYGDEVKSAVLDAGEEYDIRRLGAESYQTPNAILGWVPLVVPAIFDEEMQDYREWLDVGQGLLSIGGSFESDDITDYYFTPVELGYDHILDFSNDFVGRDALEAEADDPDREKVTLVWDGDDVVDVFASLFEEGDTYQFMEFPHPRSSACPYDEVLKDGEHVGVSTDKSYIYNKREMLSLAVVDTEYSEPGTQVTLTWGEPEGTENPKVERHVQKEITATVATAPYSEDKR